MFRLSPSLVIFSTSMLVLAACGKSVYVVDRSRFSPTSTPVSPVLVDLSEASIDDCPAGGTLVTTYRDNDGDNVATLADEFINQAKVCHGVAGNNGSDGQDGSDGTDGTDGSDGVDGANGNDASFAMGAVGSAVSGKSYSACHHDYLFFPNRDEPSRGWLTFRHQANGSADQGIGSTGFQIWNVDITDFVLASEVGGVSYCRLNWNPETRILRYEVVDTTDGLQGESGEIMF